MDKPKTTKQKQDFFTAMAKAMVNKKTKPKTQNAPKKAPKK